MANTDTRRRSASRHRNLHLQEINEYQKQYRLSHEADPIWLAGERKRHSDLMKKYRVEIISHYSPKLICISCGFSDIRALTIDHEKGNGNVHRREVGGSVALWRSLKRTGYPDGYRVLCYNCQKIVEDEKWEKIWEERMIVGFNPIKVKVPVVAIRVRKELVLEMRFKCNLCSAKFQRSYDLTVHEATHDSQPKVFAG